MLNLRAALVADIRVGIEAAQDKGVLPKVTPILDIVVEHPEDPERGDYASPVALVLAKKMKRSPMDIVHAIAAHMPKKEYIGKLEAAAPGFLNIRLHTGWMTARLNNVIEQDLCADIDIGRGRSVNLEFISANPTGPLTLANVRAAFSADTLGNVFSCAGFNVTREYYVNDAGEQIRKLGESVLRRALQAQDVATEYSDELYQGDYIKDLASVIAEEWREDEGREFTAADLENREMVGKISERAVQLMLADIKKTVTEDLHVRFDVWTSERSLREKGDIENVLNRFRQLGLVYVDGGAETLKTTLFGDDKDRVLVKSNKENAYFAPDIAYHVDKYKRGFDLIFTFVGADHLALIGKLKAALQALKYDPDKLHVVIVQWMRLVKDGKPVAMSKRRGQIVTPADLLKEVGYDSARFFMVQQSLNNHLDFDLALAAERSEKNPVYYVQYAYVRLQSILRRAKQQGIIDKIGMVFDLSNNPALTHTLELALMRQLYRFPEIITTVARCFTVHDLAYYAVELARAVHVFYRHVPVLSVEEEWLVRSRLQLMMATRVVLGRVLDLLKVGKPEVM